jgi:hypothetical protein
MADDVGAPRQSGQTATRGSVEVMSRGEIMGCARWASAFAGKHKDHRYYELVEDTIQPDFVFRYFAIKDEDGSVRAFHLKHSLDPLDLYVRHTSKFINPILRRLVPLLEPTRNDKTLPKFSNYADLWGATAPTRRMRPPVDAGSGQRLSAWPGNGEGWRRPGRRWRVTTLD